MFAARTCAAALRLDCKARPSHHPFPILQTSHLILSFQHPAFQHKFTSILGSPRIVTRLHSQLYMLHFIHPLSYSPHPSVSPLQPVFFSLCSSVVSSLALLVFISLQFTIPPSPTPVHTLPCPCCNKNSVKPYLFVSLALAKNHQ